MERVDVVVLGAGAAGLMAGIEAARRGRRVVVIDHAKAPGEKIRISGGGRCNFTNRTVDAKRFLSQNPRFALSALSRYTPLDFVARLDAAGIAWHEKTLGQLFCDGPATQVVAMLTRDLAQAGGVLRLGCTPGAVRRGTAGFEVETPGGPVQAASVIVATGGKSIPKMGASAYGYRLAEAFGLPLIETRPGLVPLTFAEQELGWIAGLAGVALMGRVTAGSAPGMTDASARSSHEAHAKPDPAVPLAPRRLGKTGVARPQAKFDEAVLFTHRGLSGPAILQASSYWREGEAIEIDVAPGHDLAAALRAAKARGGKGTLRAALAAHLPDRLARHLETAQDAGGSLAGMTDARLGAIASDLHRWRLLPVGSEGYRTAEVTLGGVATDALDPRTMEARGVPGLFFVGEVVDVTGWLGGYNFQWAWASGWAAGQVA